ncbi:MAG: hypothetical protein H6Q65_1149 [Firmicutes bacterium]|nr:hypothetical protein [Bacillota bacterium]
MKKGLMAVALAAMVSMSSGVAMAAPGDVTFDGNINLQVGEVDYPKLDVSKSGADFVLTLNGNVNVAKNLDAFARFTYQRLTDELEGTTFQLYPHATGVIDAYGLKYNNAGYKVAVGKQSLTIGSGLIYDNGFIGNQSLPYSAVVSKKVGATDLTAFYARTDYQSSVDNDKFYGLQGNYAVNDKFTVGAMFTAVKYGADNAYILTGNGTSQNFIEVSGSYQIDPKLSFGAAYAQSNADTDNQAYIGTFGYTFDDKNKASISGYRVEDLANINDVNWGGLTTAPNANTQGVTISYNHVINKNTTLSVSRSMYTNINAATLGGDNRDRVKTQASLNYSF